MSNNLSEWVPQALAQATAQAVRQCNALSEMYGQSLSDGQIASLVQGRFAALRDTGRVEPGVGVLPRLIYAFCDSPVIQRDEYCNTLVALQTLFYDLKNEAENTLTDDELIEAMKRVFDGRAQGSMEYMENLTLADLFRALRHAGREDDEDFDDDDD